MVFSKLRTRNNFRIHWTLPYTFEEISNGITIFNNPCILFLKEQFLLKGVPLNIFSN